MIRNRHLAVATLSAGLLWGLTSCTGVDPTITASAPSSGPASQLAADQRQAAAEINHTWLAICDAPAEQAATIDAIKQTMTAQAAVLAGPAPVNRMPAADSSLEACGALADSDWSTGAEAALHNWSTANRQRASHYQGVEAVFWAGLAASAEQMRQGIQFGFAPSGPVDPTVTIDTVTVEQADTALAQAYAAADFALRSATGFADPDSTTGQAIAAARSQVAANLASAPISPDTQDSVSDPAVIFQLPAGRDAAAAGQLLVVVSRGLTQTEAQWLAAQEQPGADSSRLIAAASLAAALGQGSSTWPGWPDPA
ncbi:MAG: hypothetical protein LBV30_02065 [Propionibacteriaceae bacterium]|nr:hypothetical protein [Propionibacteriaceae bacterium]